QLCDALMSGIENKFKHSIWKTTAKSSKNIYNQEIEEDIKAILKLMPQSCDYTYSYNLLKEPIRWVTAQKNHLKPQPTIMAEGRYTPLALACLNPNVSLEIVEKILNLKDGKNIKDEVVKAKHRSSKIPLILHLRDTLAPERLEAILKLFDKYNQEKN